MTRPTSGNFRRDVQGIRAIAVGAVLAFHAGLPIHGGFIGVDVFFVVSGYVITSSIRRDQQGVGGFRFRDFYFRRFRRLWPPLAALVIFTVVASALFSPPTITERSVVPTAIGALALSANLAIFSTTGDYFDSPAASNPLLHTWSLSVEEQIYLLIPLLLAAAWRFRRSRTGVIAGAITVWCVSFLMMLIGTGPNGPPRFLAALRIDGVVNKLGSGTPSFLFGFYSPFVRFWEFGVGCGMYFLADRVTHAKRPVSTRLTSWLGLVAILVAAFAITERVAYPGPWTVLPVLGTALLLLPVGANENGVVRILEHRSMQWIGDRSYSIYLWHWPVVVFAVTNLRSWPAPAVLGTVLSLIPAIGSHRWIERPSRTPKAISWPGVATLATGAIIVPALLIVATGRAAAHDFGSETLRSWRAAISTDHAGRGRGCDGVFSTDLLSTCTWNEASPGRPIYVVGDSFADHFSEGILEAASKMQRPVVVKTANACPFLDLRIVRAGYGLARTESCRLHMKSLYSFLLNASPGTVVISNAPIYHSLPEFSVSPPNGKAATRRPEKLRAMTASLTHTVEQLRKHGHSVLLVLPTPLWTAWDASRCSTVEIVTGTCSATQAQSSAMHRYADLRAGLIDVGRTASANVLDLYPSLCSRPVCRSTSGRLPRYRDGAHLSVGQSRALAAIFERALSGG